ncbi:hypothetical protein B0A77_11335 [Flavobacterium branchiophilum]|uniref:Uncharacterized protein n=2 Tax=Flavobacterium branchiophilum TaxID=55197 RepID=A0A2H3KKL0_9FLAO|nr:hypothetical protein B0A77_11335 [Flavobacterium branchiophilum]
MNKATTVGALNTMFVGGDSMMNVMGKLTEMIEGDVETHTKQEMLVNSQKGVTYNSEGTKQEHLEEMGYGK